MNTNIKKARKMLSLSDKIKAFLSDPDSKIIVNIVIGILLVAFGLFAVWAVFGYHIPLILFLLFIGGSIVLFILAGILVLLSLLPNKIRKILYRKFEIEE